MLDNQFEAISHEMAEAMFEEDDALRERLKNTFENTAVILSSLNSDEVLHAQEMAADSRMLSNNYGTFNVLIDGNQFDVITKRYRDIEPIYDGVLEGLEIVTNPLAGVVTSDSIIFKVDDGHKQRELYKLEKYVTYDKVVAYRIKIGRTNIFRRRDINNSASPEFEVIEQLLHQLRQ